MHAEELAPPLTCPALPFLLLGAANGFIRVISHQGSQRIDALAHPHKNGVSGQDLRYSMLLECKLVAHGAAGLS